MATITVADVSHIFPVATSVACLKRLDRHPECRAPGPAAIVSAAVGASGSLTLSHAGIISGAHHIGYALVAGEHRYLALPIPA